MGVADFIIGINITRTFDRLVLSPSHYVEKVLEKCFKGDNSIVKILMNISVYLFKNKDKILISQLEYSWIIKSLIHVINCTKPDIAYSVSRLGRFLSNLTIDY